MTVDRLLSEVMQLFEYLGLDVYMQAFIIITLAMALLARVVGSRD